MRNSMARRISLKRPKQSDLEALREAIDNARSRGADEEGERLLRELGRLEHRSKIIPYIDPIDVRYNRFERVPRPNTEAVMFCLMDVSGSMTEAMKDLATRFFILLHVSLIRRSRHVDIVFIRHTSTAEEVDEETFFYSRETGGTVVSTALEKMLEIARARYPIARWNIYGAQASDGDNYGADSSRCVALLGGDVLPLCQYFAYVEVGDGMGGSLTGLSRHWSFGKRFAYHETLYRKGLAGLAYEIVINSNPVICYIMEENSMTMQTLVIAHAGFGHNHFFKNNYFYRQWTDADGIMDYLSFARDYVAKCEEKHGYEAVERILDAAHALKEHGVNRY